MRQHKESYPARSASSPASCRAFITPFLFLFLLFFFPAMWDALVAPLSVLHQLEDFLIGQLTQYPEAYLKNHLVFFLVLLLAVSIVPTKKSPETSKVFKFEIYLHNQLSRVFCLTPTTTYFFFCILAYTTDLLLLIFIIKYYSLLMEELSFSVDVSSDLKEHPRIYYIVDYVILCLQWCCICSGFAVFQMSTSNEYKRYISNWMEKT